MASPLVVRFESPSTLPSFQFYSKIVGKIGTQIKIKKRGESGDRGGHLHSCVLKSFSQYKSIRTWIDSVHFGRSGSVETEKQHLSAQVLMVLRVLTFIFS